MFTKYDNEAEVEITEVYRYEDGAEVEAEAVYKYEDGAEVEVWSAGIPPLGLYARDSILINKGIIPTINGDTIALPCVYSGATDGQSRIVVFVESDTPPLVTIDCVDFWGESWVTSGSKMAIWFATMSYNPKSNALSGAEAVSMAAVSALEFATVENISKQFNTVRTNGYYVIVETRFSAGNFNSAYVYNEIPVFISGLRINGQKVVGNMTGVYIS